MDKAVAEIIGATAIQPLPFGLAPGRGGTNFVDPAHRPNILLVVESLGISRKSGFLRRPYRRPPLNSRAASGLVTDGANRLLKVKVPSSCPGSTMVRHPKAPRMLTHVQVWGALDRLAERAGLSASGLGKKTGGDATPFKKSTRITPDGRERWPSTESIAKALAATNSSIDSFVQLIGDGPGGVQSM